MSVPNGYQGARVLAAQKSRWVREVAKIEDEVGGYLTPPEGSQLAKLLEEDFVVVSVVPGTREEVVPMFDVSGVPEGTQTVRVPTTWIYLQRETFVPSKIRPPKVKRKPTPAPRKGPTKQKGPKAVAAEQRERKRARQAAAPGSVPSDE